MRGCTSYRTSVRLPVRGQYATHLPGTSCSCSNCARYIEGYLEAGRESVLTFQWRQFTFKFLAYLNKERNEAGAGVES